ncbi:alkane hydroxylase MAH1-like [Andrographis paniculata]|uniref:alkane hydroxylase MAH1-like n=1 Tax=Andrographis paniculata TaxID=175694 RepID=UPI0021E892E4|nr:alkane hydroxylase MAH1-like [Andrographis paniculata]
MAIVEFPTLIFLSLITIFILILTSTRTTKTTSAPTNWPILGMLPGLLRNRHRIHSYAAEILAESGGTFELIGPWFCNMDMLITSDPANIHYIFSRNFANYPKGPEFRKIFEILGDGIFNADFELWELHRKTTLSYFSNEKFYTLLEKAVSGKIQTGLMPVLEFLSERDREIDLQDVFQRFTFDSICKLVLDHDPESLSPEFPIVPCGDALNDALEALLHRHVLPEVVWKFQKWLRIGKEKKLIEAWESIDEFVYRCLSSKQSEYSGAGDGFSLLESFKQAYEESNVRSPPSATATATRVFLRDTALNLMLAGRDTTSTCLTWLFWLLSAHPAAAERIREEIKEELQVKQGRGNWRGPSVEDTRRLVYLHGALCESLRLFPPVALEHKAPVRADVLPTGNRLRPEARVILSFYSTGRMEEVWGKDCLEFRPERWRTARGGVMHAPSYKFPAFNAGPRTCLGKEMAFVQMKMVAAAVVWHYRVEVVEEVVAPRDSIILHAKHGLRVRLLSRSDSN